MKNRLFGAALAALLVLTGCQFAPVSPGSSDPTTATLRISVPAAAKALSSRSALGNASDLTAVTLSVYPDAKRGVSTALVKDYQLSLVDGSWVGTLERLPVDTPLVFQTSGWENETETFRGSQVESLEAGTNLLTLTLSALTDDQAYVFPSLVNVILDRALLIDEDVNLVFAVKGTPDTYLDFSLTADDGQVLEGGDCVYVASNGRARFSVGYHTPAVSGPARLTLSLKDEKGQEVKQDFVLTINPLGNASFQVHVGPSLQNFSARLAGSDVVWTAQVSDDQPLGESSWTFDGSTLPSTGLSATLGDYTEATSGTIHFSVTDADGITTWACFQVPAGLFPDNPWAVQAPAEPVVVAPANLTHVVVLRNEVAWDYDSLGAILRNRGLTEGQGSGTFEVVPVEDFSADTLDPAQDLLVISSVQTLEFYQQLAGHLASIEAFANAGGHVLWSVCDYSGTWEHSVGLTLPGGATVHEHGESTNYVVAEGDPAVEGVPSTFPGDWASHDWVSVDNPGAQVLVRGGESGGPTLVRLPLGSGEIYYSGLTLEYGYAEDEAAGDILVNLIHLLVAQGEATPQ